MAELTLGINNAFAARNWPEPAAWAGIVARELGLRHVQFSFDLLDPTLPEPDLAGACEEIRREAAAAGLSLDTTFTGLIAYAQNLLVHPDPRMREHARRWYARAIEATRMLGAAATGGHVGALSLADQADAARRAMLVDQAIAAVKELTRQAAAAGQEYFLWEFMPLAQELIHTPEEAVAVLGEANDGAAIPILLCFDLGHCAPDAGGRVQDPHAWLARLLPWTRVVHLQQTDGLADHHWPFTPEHAAEGIVDPARVVEIARSSPLPQVDLVFEIGHPFDAAPQTIIDNHKMSIECFSRRL